MDFGSDRSAGDRHWKAVEAVTGSAIKHCCEDKESELAALHQQQSHVLKIVLAIDADVLC